MSTIGDRVFDAGLEKLGTAAGEAEILHLCSAEPANYAGIAAVDLGNDNGELTISTPADRAGGGRESTVTAIANGDVTGTGTVNFWAIADITNTRLLSTGAAGPQAVTSGNSFTLTSFKVGIPDPA